LTLNVALTTVLRTNMLHCDLREERPTTRCHELDAGGQQTESWKTTEDVASYIQRGP